MPSDTVRVNVPELHIALPVVMPSEKLISPSSPTSTSIKGLVAIAPVSPVIVISELLEEDKRASGVSVTVILFVAAGAGLLWPMSLVEKDADSTDVQLASKISKITAARLLFSRRANPSSRAKFSSLSCRPLASIQVPCRFR